LANNTGAFSVWFKKRVFYNFSSFTETEKTKKMRTEGNWSMWVAVRGVGGVAGGPDGVAWCVRFYLSQRYILIRFCGGGCCVCLSYFAPLKRCTVVPVGSWPEVVRLVAGCMAGDTPHPSSTDGTI